MLLLQAEFPCSWTPSLGSSLVGPIVPIFQVIFSQGLFVLKPQTDQVPGDHSPLLSAGGAAPRFGSAQECQQSLVATWPSCSPGPWPAGRPSSAGACHPALAGVPLASSSLQCTQHSASGFLSCPGLSELSSGFIFGRSYILSPYLLQSFREGVGPLGSAGDQAVALASGVWTSLGLRGRGPPKTPEPSDASKPIASVLLPPPSV